MFICEDCLKTQGWNVFFRSFGTCEMCETPGQDCGDVSHKSILWKTYDKPAMMKRVKQVKQQRKLNKGGHNEQKE